MKKYSRTKQQPKKNMKYPLLACALVVLAVAGYFAFFKTDPPKTPPSPSTGDIATRQETSEGSTFPVPEDTPEDAITDYRLITENDQYKIRREGDTNRYIITLYAIINRPEQYEDYKNQLRDFKRSALDYLTAQGVDVNKLEITYEPEEAAQL